MLRTACRPATLLARAGGVLVACGALAACDPPFEGPDAQSRAIVTVETRAYLVRSRFDPFQRAHYADVLPIQGRRDAIDATEAARLLDLGLGRELCGETGRLVPVEGVWSLWTGAEPVTAYETRGGWQIVARCA